MTNREVRSSRATLFRQLPVLLRPGFVVGIAVAGVVGVVGLVQWDRNLMVFGFLAAAVIVAVNLVVALARYWHASNTGPSTTYVGAEEVVRLRQPKAR